MTVAVQAGARLELEPAARRVAVEFAEEVAFNSTDLQLMADRGVRSCVALGV